jgi:glucosylceramidase
MQNNPLPFLLIASLGLIISQSCSENKADRVAINSWITTPDRSALLAPSPAFYFDEHEPTAPVIEVDTSVVYQTLDGFGFALTGGSAMLLNTKLSADQRAALLRELFLTEGEGIGISYLRVSIGSSDLDELIFTYNDLPKGQTDVTLSNFSLSYDTLHLIPVLKEILALNPGIKIMGSPWSPPVWMKTNGLPKGGSLKKEYYTVYANYFVRYLNAMANHGILIDAVTLQNEPENPNNTPSLVMTAEEQNEFIKNHLGPAFKQAGITTKIVVFDHNCDHPEYPIAILNDVETRTYVDGSAFHLYLGEISALNKVHNVHPDKNIYFTEQWTSGRGDFGGDLRWHVKNLVIGAPRNWSRTVIEWNLAADENFDPHTNDGGCDSCQGALTIGNTVGRNVSYYIIGHASRFVPPGSVRIESSLVNGLPNVAFRTPAGEKVLLVLNDADQPQSFSIRSNNKTATTQLAVGAVATYVWK